LFHGSFVPPRRVRERVQGPSRASSKLAGLDVKFRNPGRACALACSDSSREDHAMSSHYGKLAINLVISTLIM
jgi:hypothetical protein